MLHRIRKLSLLAAVAALGLALSGCDPEEQGRILQYEKGTYLGKSDEALSPEARDALRSRVSRQRGV